MLGASVSPPARRSFRPRPFLFRGPFNSILRFNQSSYRIVLRVWHEFEQITRLTFERRANVTQNVEIDTALSVYLAEIPEGDVRNAGVSRQPIHRAPLLL